MFRSTLVSPSALGSGERHGRSVGLRSTLRRRSYSTKDMTTRPTTGRSASSCLNYLPAGNANCTAVDRIKEVKSACVDALACCSCSQLHCFTAIVSVWRSQQMVLAWYSVGWNSKLLELQNWRLYDQWPWWWKEHVVDCVKKSREVLKERWDWWGMRDIVSVSVVSQSDMSSLV